MFLFHENQQMQEDRDREESRQAPERPVIERESQQEQEVAYVLRIPAPPVWSGRGEVARIKAKDLLHRTEDGNTDQTQGNPGTADEYTDQVQKCARHLISSGVLENEIWHEKHHAEQHHSQCGQLALLAVLPSCMEQCDDRYWDRQGQQE
jgi:hypothetical protein